MLLDLPYQALLLVLDTLLLAGVWTRSSSTRWYWFGAVGIAGLGAALLFAHDLMHLMRLASWLWFIYCPVVSIVTAVLTWSKRRNTSIGWISLAASLSAVDIDA